MISLLLAAALGSAQANQDSYVEQCGSMLSTRWRDEVAKHPIDTSKHVPVVLLYIPTSLPERSFEDARHGLEQAFPSFKENPGSGILLGCCSYPLYGSISFDDLAKLVAARFVPLCEIAVSSVQMRIEFREPYERGIGTAPYFWISF